MKSKDIDLFIHAAHLPLSIAIAAGVPVVPGTPGPIKSIKEAEAFVKRTFTDLRRPEENGLVFLSTFQITLFHRK